jgi:hypothetical protein
VKAYGFRPPADLIILLNPAVDSLEGKAMIEGMMRLNIKAETELLDAVTKTTKSIPRPLFFSISSQRDLATRRLMPMAQWVTLAGKSSTRKNYGDDASSRGQASQRKQSYYFDNSEANVPEMRTHTICLVPTGERSRKELEKDKADDCSPSEGRYPFTVGKNSYFMKPQSGAWNTTPFWVVHPPGSLIRNHWDIFNSDVTGFLKWIIQTYGMGQTRIVIQ